MSIYLSMEHLDLQFTYEDTWPGLGPAKKLYEGQMRELAVTQLCLTSDLL